MTQREAASLLRSRPDVESWAALLAGGEGRQGAGRLPTPTPPPPQPANPNFCVTRKFALGPVITA